MNETMNVLSACGEASVMIMGMSFVVGSLTTVLVLVLLDFYRAHQAEQAAKDE